MPVNDDYLIENKATEYLLKAGLNESQIESLRSIGYFTAPASKGHHLAEPHGLIRHSVNVTDEILCLQGPMDVLWSRPESPFIIGMLHDLVKAYCYKEKEPGKYTYVQPPFSGHGTASVMIAVGELGLSLTPQEIACISAHMGAFGLDEKALKEYSAIVDRYPRETICVHTADMYASRVLEG